MMKPQRLQARLHALAGMEVAALRDEWKRLYRGQPPARISRQLLELGIAWKLQEAALGGLGRATQRLLGSAVDAGTIKSQSRAIVVKPGSRLVREWRGETHDVLVVDGGYEWRGQRWTSLSMIAREITGTQWSGPRFFGLEKRSSKRTETAGENADG
jgi:hypothetical protein